MQSFLHTIKRYHTLKSHRISALPVVILMPHSACNCRCVMCDIWKGNRNARSLNAKDIGGLLAALRRFGTRQVLMSGGEALLHPDFFGLCRLLKKEKIHITLLSTGLGLKQHAESIVEYIHDIIVSLDGDEETHDRIRNIPGAYAKLSEGVQRIRNLDPLYRIGSRTVIHRLNYEKWPAIINAAKAVGVDSVSFLPADVSSQAFNRDIPWEQDRQDKILIPEEQLPHLRYVTDDMIHRHAADFDSGFISERREKILNIHRYYSAVHGLGPFPYKRCNAPWVSTVIEPDGSVRPCFFHHPIGNIRQGSLPEILNGSKGMQFRRALDMDNNETCKRCVCYLNLPASMDPVK